MPTSDHAYNIIINLAHLPDFLRTEILKQRVKEFFSMDEQYKNDVVNSALEVGPSIPFTNFSKLFKTWLIVLTTVSEENRISIISKYINKIITVPQKFIEFNLDGIFGIFITLKDGEKKIIIKTINDVINNIDINKKNRLLVLVPDNIKSYLFT